MQNNKLISIINEKGIKLSFLAKHLGLTKTTFRNKLHGTREFKVSEAEKLGKYLNLSQDDFCDTFFS